MMAPVQFSSDWIGWMGDQMINVAGSFSVAATQNQRLAAYFAYYRIKQLASGYQSFSRKVPQ